MFLGTMITMTATPHDSCETSTGGLDPIESTVTKGEVWLSQVLPGSPRFFQEIDETLKISITEQGALKISITGL